MLYTSAYGHHPNDSSPALRNPILRPGRVRRGIRAGIPRWHSRLRAVEAISPVTPADQRAAGLPPKPVQSGCLLRHAAGARRLPALPAEHCPGRSGRAGARNRPAARHRQRGSLSDHPFGRKKCAAYSQFTGAHRGESAHAVCAPGHPGGFGLFPPGEPADTGGRVLVMRRRAGRIDPHWRRHRDPDHPYRPVPHQDRHHGAQIHCRKSERGQAGAGGEPGRRPSALGGRLA